MSVAPQVSVVLPVHNGAATLERALVSLRAQTLRDWEALVINNGSTDATADLLAVAVRKDERIRVLDMPAPDLVGALNRGLASARGALIARFDADDEMHPERFARQAATLAAQPDWGVVGCGVTFGGDAAAQAGYAEHVDWLNGLRTPVEIAHARFVDAPLAHPSVMWRRAVHEAHGGYRSGDFPEDFELWLRWLEAGVCIGKVPETLLTWHDSPGRLSRSDERYRLEAFYATKAEYLARELARNGGDRAVWIAGAGRPTRQRAALLEEQDVEIAGYADIDPRKIGGRVSGRPVVAIADLPPPTQAVVLSYVGQRGARSQVQKVLAAQGRDEGRDFWLCA